jgi:hypothetical protein
MTVLDVDVVEACRVDVVDVVEEEEVDVKSQYIKSVYNLSFDLYK